MICIIRNNSNVWRATEKLSEQSANKLFYVELLSSRKFHLRTFTLKKVYKISLILKILLLFKNRKN